MELKEKENGLKEKRTKWLSGTDNDDGGNA